MSIIETIDEIDRLISNSAAVSAIKSLLISLREQAEALESRVRALESKSQVKRLQGEVDFLRTQLDSTLKEKQALEDVQQTKEELVEHRGAFFKRKHEGGYHEAVYCPKCRNSAGSMDGFEIQYSCVPCRWVATFAPMDLPKIIAELP
jgi:hypothetical protein